MFKIIVAGTRMFNDYNLLKKQLNSYIKSLSLNQNDIEIVSGTAYGADKLGEKYALENNLSIKKFPAEWARYGKAAGPIRNAQIAKYADAAIVFWDEQSRGTKNMIDCMNKVNKKCKVIIY